MRYSNACLRLFVVVLVFYKIYIVYRDSKGMFCTCMHQLYILTDLRDMFRKHLLETTRAHAKMMWGMYHMS